MKLLSRLSIALFGVLLLVAAVGNIYYEVLPGLVIKSPATGATTFHINGTNGVATGTFVGDGSGLTGMLWTNLPPLTDMEGGTVYGMGSVNRYANGLITLAQGYQTNNWDDVGNVVSIGYPPVDGMTLLSNLNDNLFFLGTFVGASQNITNSYDCFWLSATYSGGGNTIVDSSAVFTLGKMAGDDQYLTNCWNVFNLGSLAGDSQNLASCHDVYNFGSGSGSSQQMTNCSDVFNIGSNANSFQAFTSQTHMFALGSGAVTTNSNDFVFGDSAYNYFFPGASMRVDNGIWIGGDCSALSFTDRSRSPTNVSEAYAIVASHKAKDGKVDHTTLHTSAWGKTKTGTPDQSTRDLGMVISAQQMVIQDLITRIEKLEKKP